MTYSQCIDVLRSYKEEKFSEFQRKLIPTKQKILGVRTPTLRKLAKQYAEDFTTIFDFPDEYYEVTFIKLTMVSALPYEQFILYVDKCVSLLDNWATCDSFKAKCIKGHKEDFLSIIEKIFNHGSEFYQRYALVVLLAEYVEEKYVSILKKYISTADTAPYYVHMAAAWLTAEILVKLYDKGVEILQSGILDIKTHNKAIQKAVESYRLTTKQKENLRSLKIK